jgi:hypothetical protein
LGAISPTQVSWQPSGYTPTLFSDTNYQASCEGMAARDMQNFAGNIGQSLFLQGLFLVLIAVVTGMLKLLSLCMNAKEPTLERNDFLAPASIMRKDVFSEANAMAFAPVPEPVTSPAAIPGDDAVDYDLNARTQDFSRPVTSTTLGAIAPTYPLASNGVLVPSGALGTNTFPAPMTSQNFAPASQLQAVPSNVVPIGSQALPPTASIESQMSRFGSQFVPPNVGTGQILAPSASIASQNLLPAINGGSVGPFIGSQLMPPSGRASDAPVTMLR